MNNNSNITPPANSEDLEMANELASLTATVLRSVGLNPLSDDETQASFVSAFSQAGRLLLQIDKERPELGLRADLRDLIRRYAAGELVNPAATLIALMERAGLRQTAASA